MFIWRSEQTSQGKEIFVKIWVLSGATDNYCTETKTNTFTEKDKNPTFAHFQRLRDRWLLQRLQGKTLQWRQNCQNTSCNVYKQTIFCQWVCMLCLFIRSICYSVFQLLFVMLSHNFNTSLKKRDNCRWNYAKHFYWTFINHSSVFCATKNLSKRKICHMILFFFAKNISQKISNIFETSLCCFFIIVRYFPIESLMRFFNNILLLCYGKVETRSE